MYIQYKKKIFTEISDSLQNHDKINLLEKDLSSSMNTQQNVTYKLFTLGPAESKELRNRQCKLMKDVPKEYQILVRTKTDYIEVQIFLVHILLLMSTKL